MSLFDWGVLRIQAPKWNGEGLPPVGCECEIMAKNYDDADWLKFNIFFVKGECLFGETESGIPVAFNINDEDGYYLRPIRTEAERKREETVKSLMIAVNGFMTIEERVLAENIYDAIAAGKIPNVKLEEY